MIIINDKPGQLCNQLWSYAPFIGCCLEYETNFLTLYFENNFHLFENLNTNRNIKFGYFHQGRMDIYFRKALLRYIRIIPNALLKSLNIYVDKKNWKNENWEESLFRKKNKVIFVGAGCHRKNNSYLNKYHTEICKIFEPKKAYKEAVLASLKEQRSHFDVIVGIHIRRGDYKDFLGGIYYYQDETYLKFMSMIRDELHSSGRKVVFLLCSNEKLEKEAFSNVDTFQIPAEQAMTDLFALSQCDYILGPPSTYSMWASYYGKVPLKFVKNEHEQINLVHFSEIIAQDTFANGNILVHE